MLHLDIVWFFKAENHCQLFLSTRSFRSGSNAIIPRPTWPITINYPGNVYPSTTPPKSETDYNAMDFNLWNDLGHEFMVKSNINHWIACQEGSGSLVDFKQGNLQCRIIKNIAVKCHNYVPDQLILHSAGNPAGSTLGPDLIRSQSTSRLKEYYYFESNTRTGNWPTHDPCGTNGLNHLTQVNGPRGNIYIREWCALAWSFICLVLHCSSNALSSKRVSV